MTTVTSPCLVLTGNDEAHPLPISEALARLLPNAELVREWKTEPALGSARARVKEFLGTHTPHARPEGPIAHRHRASG